MATNRDENPVAHELKVAARGRAARTPFVVLVSVSVAIFVVFALIAGVALLVWWLG
jgi:hypothetical protein